MGHRMAYQVKAGLGTHMVGGENWLSYIVLWLPHMRTVSHEQPSSNKYNET